MKWTFTAILALIPSMAWAVPNSIIGPLAAVNSPLNGQDLTAALTSGDLWAGKVDLPGNWQDECRIATAEISYLLARPEFLGEEVVLMRATRRDDRLAALDVTFADAGSFFGYFDEKLPTGLSRREAREEIALRTSKRRAEFAENYAETLTSLNDRLAQMSANDKSRPRPVKVGHTRTLRSEMRDFPAGDLTFRLLAADERLIRVTVARTEDLPKSWLDPSIEALAPRERLPRLQPFKRLA